MTLFQPFPLRRLARALPLLAYWFAAGAVAQPDHLAGDVIHCANLIYAGTKTSRCFSDRFLQRLSLDTNILTDGKFTPVKLADEELYKHPFAVMTGEGRFALTGPERANLRNYLLRGGFLLASAGCSNPEWGASFRREAALVFPRHKLVDLPLSHPVFHTVYDIAALQTAKQRRRTKLQGLSLDGRLAIIFSPDGLNDTEHTKNCCCCGGDEVLKSEFINVNVLAYALLH